jgi:hypothetical protein
VRSRGTGDGDAVVFFGEGGEVRGASVFVFLKVEFAEVGVEGEMFYLAFFEVFGVVWLESLMMRHKGRLVLRGACSSRTSPWGRVCIEVLFCAESCHLGHRGDHRLDLVSLDPSREAGLVDEQVPARHSSPQAQMGCPCERLQTRLLR